MTGDDRHEHGPDADPGAGAEEPTGERPEDGAADAPPAAPTPTTWAGRQRSDESEVEEGGEPEAEELDEDTDAEDTDDGEDLEDELDDEELAEEELAQEIAPDGDGASPVEVDTVEAQTLALGDREAAREAALAGLRARTAEHAAKQGTGVTPVGVPAVPVETESPQTEAPVAEPAPVPADVPPAERPPPQAEPEPEKGPPGRGLWARFLAGSLLIVVAMATATSVSLLVYLTDFARGLGGLPSVQNQLEVADPGNPQTILILGSDKRPHEKFLGARSDTTILMRVAADQITVMSIPRDLKVNIPGHGIDKFNAAYSFGGPKLTLKVVKQLTGLTNINHVINVDFTGFADAVDTIGCVYDDVDHHYYHSNVGLAAADQYAAIDIPAGYQRMCGFKALQYVRYRHDDNDLVRSARQQDFLRQVRQQLPPTKLISDRNQLVDIMKRYVTSDIRHPEDLISLGKLFLAARSAPVVQIHFPANLGGSRAAYVTASASAIRQAVARFEGVAPSPPPTPSTQASQPPSGGSKGGAPHKPAPPPLIDSSVLGQQYAAKLAAQKEAGGKPVLGFPVYYPTKLAPSSTITSDSDAFRIDGPGNAIYHGYKFVAALPTGGYTAYYGVSGTDWKDPPILANPDETKTINGNDYLESWDGGALRLVGWKTDRGSYWVDNTLLNVLSPGQMLGIAQSLRKYTG